MTIERRSKASDKCSMITERRSIASDKSSMITVRYSIIPEMCSIKWKIETWGSRR